MRGHERFSGLCMNVNEHNLVTSKETRKMKSLCAIFTNEILSIEVLSKRFFNPVFDDTFRFYRHHFALGLDI
jgi:hypothetical protein